MVPACLNLLRAKQMLKMHNNNVDIQQKILILLVNSDHNKSWELHVLQHVMGFSVKLHLQVEQHTMQTSQAVIDQTQCAQSTAWLLEWWSIAKTNSATLAFGDWMQGCDDMRFPPTYRTIPKYTLVVTSNVILIRMFVSHWFYLNDCIPSCSV